MSDPTQNDDTATETTKPRRRFRFLKRLGIGLGVLLILVALAPLALRLSFVRDAVADRIGESLGRTVSIGSASGWWTSGIELEDIVVSSPDGFEKPLATVARVHADVDLLALVGGRVDAAVRIEQPVVHLLKDASGRRNADGLLPDDPDEEADADADGDGDADEDASSTRLHLELVGGHVTANGFDPGPPHELDEIEVVLDLDGRGGLGGHLAAIARRAAPGGGDARFTIDAREGTGTGAPWTVALPRIDLARIGGLVEGLTGARGLRGTVEATGEGRRGEGGTTEGTVTTKIRGLALTTSSGTSLALASGDLGVVLAPVAGEPGFRATGALTDVLVVTGDAEARRVFREPSIQLVVRGVHDRAAKRLTLHEGRIDAGSALSASLAEAGWLDLGPKGGGEGAVDVRADLARLAGLRAFLPELATVASGALTARIAGTSGETGSATLTLRVSQFVLEGGGVPDELRLTASVREQDGQLRLEPVDLNVFGVQARGHIALPASAPAARDLDVQLTLDGDPARLAAALRPFLGDEYRDLAASGRIQGSIALGGDLKPGLAGLRTRIELTPGAWAAGGLTLSSARLQASRPTTRDPLTITLAAGLNGGTVKLDAGLTPSTATEALPWTLKLVCAGVDTSPLLVDHGLGRYLGYFLPSLLPSNVRTPVLSGRLNVDVALAARDWQAPLREATLEGRGTVGMVEGEIGQSTLFQHIGGGRGLGDVGGVLLRAVPEVGGALSSLTRSLTFSRLDSRFAVARQVVTVEQGLLVGDRTRLEFRGTVAFDRRTDLHMALTLAGKAGERLARVLPGPSLPLRVTGMIDAPNVVPDLRVQDIAGGALGELIPDAVKDPLDRLRGLLPR